MAGTMPRAGAGTAVTGIADGVMPIGMVATAVVTLDTTMMTAVSVVSMIMGRIVASGDIALMVKS